jgi:hypothetical protein
MHTPNAEKEPGNAIVRDFVFPVGATAATAQNKTAQPIEGNKVSAFGTIPVVLPNVRFGW